MAHVDFDFLRDPDCLCVIRDYTFSILTADTLNDGIFAIGSSEVLLVSTLAAASLKWKGMNTTPFAGRLDTRVFTVMEPAARGHLHLRPALEGKLFRVSRIDLDKGLVRHRVDLLSPVSSWNRYGTGTAVCLL